VADTIDANIAADVAGLLAANGIERDAVGAWIAHPGGPRVLEAFERGLGLDHADLEPSWRSLEAAGNLSSSSVLHVLADTLRQEPGTHGVLFALGPGVTSEYVLLRWAASSVEPSLVWFTALILLTGAERIAELVISTRNAAWAFARGGVESGRGHFPAMVALHTGLLLGALAEVWLLGRPFLAWLGWPMLALALLCQVGRYGVIWSLGRQWNTRVIVVPGMPLSRRGLYRWERLRHPNYWIVAIEGVALPLVHTAWITALVFTVLNAILLLRFRIPAEERALKAAAPA